MFDYVESISARPQVCTRRDFDRIADSQRVKALIDRITLAQTPEEVGQLKRQLPAFCFHAHFIHGRRVNAEAEPSRLVMLDVDHVEGRVDHLWERLRTAFFDMGGLLAHKTPSGHGLRLVMPMPSDCLRIAEAQALYARRLGLNAIDTCTCDLARLSFAVSRGYIYYVGSGLFDPQVPTAPQAVPPSPPSLPLASQGEGEQSSTTYPDTYQGVPYQAIVKALEHQLGGQPEHGARNRFILTMACCLRHVCDDDVEWIAQLLPTYGEATAKWRRTLESACSYPLPRSMPRLLRRAIDCATRDRGAALAMAGLSPLATGQEGDGDAPANLCLPPLPERLPPLIELLVSKVPPHYKPAVAQAVFPPLGAHLGGVKFRYIDNVDHEATFMCVLMAPMSSGKSCVNKPIEYIMADIVRRDDVARRRENEWKELCASRSSNKDKPRRPTDLCVQVLVSDMTNAAFVQRLRDAKGQFLYTVMDEIELLDCLKTSHRSHQVTQILRLAFDCACYGQERVGTQSVTAQVRVKWNWNASTTVRKGQRYFENSLTDGTLSRLNICTIVPPADAQVPVIGSYDDLFAQQLQPYIDRLNGACGRITCEEAEVLARRMAAENAERAALSGDETFGQLSYRANVIAYLKAMVLYVAEGRRWSREIEDFVRWSEDYDMQCKLAFFGDMMDHELEREVSVRKRGPANALDLLPDVFTRADVEALRRRAGLKSGRAALLGSWTARHYVVKHADGNTFSKTQAYLRKCKLAQG